MSAARRKIAILGGGMGGVAAAWALTQQPDWRDRYEITLYQRGWRLGGKAAGGRNLAKQGRIETPGGHVWSGSYRCALGMMRGCYAALASLGLRQPEAPLGSFDKAFKPLNHAFVPEPAAPGDAGAPLEPWRIGFVPDASAATPDDPAAYAARLATLLHTIQEMAEASAAAGDSAGCQRLALATGLLAAAAAGMKADDLAGRGFGHLDQWNIRAWLARHGAPEQALASGIMAAAEGFAAGYPGPASNGSGMGAGTFLHNLCRTLFGAAEALFYKMQAGPGDTVFAPLYQVLAARGVHFRFFHAVTGLRLDTDRSAIAAIAMTRQALTPQARPLADYDPLAAVRNLPAWPAEPLWEQLADGASLATSRPDFEDESAPPAGEPLTLLAGEDFDDAVLAIGIGALPSLTPELAAASPAWASMLANVPTSAVQTAQLWLTVPSAEYGWKQLADTHNPGSPSGNRPLQTLAAGLTGGFETWSDVSDLLARAEWGFDDRPWSAAAFTRLLPDPAGEASTAAAAEDMARWLDRHLLRLWPHMQGPDGRFLYSALHDPEGRSGAARLAWQHFWTGAHGSQRQTLSPPGSLQHRLPPDGSGFRNLYLAGDWTLNGIDAASMEAAAVSGFQAAEAIARTA